MIDLKKLQNGFNETADKLRKKKIKEEVLKELQRLFIILKEEKSELEKLQAQQNKKSKLFPLYLKEKKLILKGVSSLQKADFLF